MTLPEFSAKLEELIINDQLQDALKLLKKFSKSSPELHLSPAEKNTLIDLIQNTQGRLSGLERDQHLGTIKGDDYRAEMNSIRQSVLGIQNIIDETAQGGSPSVLNPPPISAKNAATGQLISAAPSQTDDILKIVILVFAGLCGVAFLVFLFMGDDMLEGAALSFTGVAGSIYGYMRFRIMETTLQFVRNSPSDLDEAALSAALNKNILQLRK